MGEEVIMTLEEEKVESEIKCPRCGTLNPLDTIKCIHCAAILRKADRYAAPAAADETK